MSGDPNDPFEIIARILVPYLGASMARAALQVNREKLGLQRHVLAPEDADRLLDALSPGLHVFLGQGQTQRILDQIRSALARARAGADGT